MRNHSSNSEGITPNTINTITLSAITPDSSDNNAFSAGMAAPVDMVRGQDSDLDSDSDSDIVEGKLERVEVDAVQWAQEDCDTVVATGMSVAL